MGQIHSCSAVRVSRSSAGEYVVDLGNKAEETCAWAGQQVEKASYRYQEPFSGKVVMDMKFHVGSKVLLLLVLCSKRKGQWVWTGSSMWEAKSCCSYAASRTDCGCGQEVPCGKQSHVAPMQPAEGTVGVDRKFHVGSKVLLLLCSKQNGQ